MRKISSNAEAAREQSRRPDGRFGEQHLGEVTFDDAREEFSVDEFDVNYDIRKAGRDGEWTVTLTNADRRSQDFSVYVPIQRTQVAPSPRDAVNTIADTARRVDGSNFESWCEESGVDPDYGYEDYETELAVAHDFRRIMGDQGYAALVHGDPNANIDLPPDSRQKTGLAGFETPTAHLDDDVYEDEITDLLAEQPDEVQWRKRLAQIHDYRAVGETVTETTGETGRLRYRHEFAIEDPDSGRSIELTYLRWLSASPPNPDDVVAAWAEDLAVARDCGYDVDEYMEALGEVPGDWDARARIRQELLALQQFELFLGDRADLYTNPPWDR